MDINKHVGFYNKPSETSMFCGTWGFQMLTHLTLIATILGETYYYFYFEKKGAKTAR